MNAPPLWRRILSPYAMVIALYAIILASVALAGRGWIMFGLGAALVFCVANPMACALRDSWWVETIVSGAFFFGTLVLYQILNDMGAIRLTDDAMVFIGPVMFYLIAVPISGVIRVVRWRMKRA